MFRLHNQKVLRHLFVVATIWFSALSLPPTLLAQQDEMELIERVEALSRQLQSDQINERDEAQQALIDLGHHALDYLETPGDATTDLRNRIGVIRKELEKQAVALASRPTRVTLQGTMTLDQALEKIKQQTGNEVYLDFAEVGEKETSLDLNNLTFWEAIDRICEQAKLTIAPYGGTAGKLRLMPRDTSSQSKEPRRRIPTDYSSIFQIKELEKQAVALASRPTRVTLQGTMTLDQALEKIKQQTGNEVYLDFAEVGEKETSLDLNNLTFWEAIDRICEQAKLTIAPYGGTAGKLRLMPRDTSPQSKEPQRRIPTDYSSIFQIKVTQVNSVLNLVKPHNDRCEITLVARWEPRLCPISIDVPLRDVKIIDEFQDPVAVSDPNAVIYGMIQPEFPEMQFSLPIQRVSREIEELESLTATINVVLPGRTETFRFRKVSDQRPGRKIEKAGATVTFGGLQKNDDLYMVTISLSFDEEHNALESHQGWVFENEIYLENAQGEREESIGLETVQQDNSKVTIRYLFLNDPGERTLIYRTPAAIVHLPIKVEFKKIPLP